LSASDKKLLRRSALAYLYTALGCGAFALIYEHFSHGVYSPFMTCLFAVPLLFGLWPLGWLLFSRGRAPGRLSRRLWGAAAATLTVGACLRGVFDIYGTTVALVSVYWWAGGLLAAAAVLTGILGHRFDAS